MKRLLAPLALVAAFPVTQAVADCPVRNVTNYVLKLLKPADGFDQYGNAITFIEVQPGGTATIGAGQAWDFSMMGNYTGRTCQGDTAYEVSWVGGFMKITP